MGPGTAGAGLLTLGFLEAQIWAGTTRAGGRQCRVMPDRRARFAVNAYHHGRRIQQLALSRCRAVEYKCVQPIHFQLPSLERTLNV